jgi:ACS family glucarate transporter-like MFS transporter
VILLCATATAGYLCRVNISVAAALLMQDYQLSQIEMGRVFSAFLFGYALCQIPGGMLADRFGARRVVGLLGWGWVVLTGAQALVGFGPLPASAGGVIGSLLILRFALGAATAPTYPSSAQGVARWASAPAQGRASGIVIGSVGLGSALAPPFVTAVMTQWGWRAAIAASAVPALVVAVIWLFVREPAEAQTPRTAIAPSHADESNLRSALQLLRRPGFALLTLSYSLQGYVGYIFVFWFYLYLVQERHFDLMQSAVIGAIPWVLSIVSIPLGGFISDRLVTGRLGPAWGRRIIPIVGMAGSGVFISIGAHTANAYIAAAALSIATALVLSVEGPFWATMVSMSGTRAGAGGGIMNTGCNIGGLISPALTPVLAASLGWEPALHLAAGLSVIAGLAWLGIPFDRE